MGPLAFPLTHPLSFWSTAVIVTAYHATRAWVGNGQAVADENHRRASLPGQSAPLIPRWQRIFIHQIHDAFFHVVCCMAGFVSVYAFSRLFTRLVKYGELSAGSGIVMALLVVVGIAGVAGVLPPMLMFGKMLPSLLGQSN